MVLSTMQTALAVVSGSIVGFSLGLVGGGGSILAVPLLVYVVGLDNPHVAIGTSAIAVALNAAANLAMHARAGNVKWQCATRLRGGRGRRRIPRLDARQDDGWTTAARVVRRPYDGCRRADAAGPLPRRYGRRSVVEREPAQAAGARSVRWCAIGLLWNRRRLPDRAGADIGHRDADPESNWFVAGIGHRFRADHGRQLCLVRSGGLAACRSVRDRRAPRRPPWRQLRKVPVKPQRRADDSVRACDLCCGNLHAGPQPKRALRSHLPRRFGRDACLVRRRPQVDHLEAETSYRTGRRFFRRG